MAAESYELRIGMLEKQSQRIDNALQKLADDMHKLTGFSIQQAEDRTALRRAFDQIDVLGAKVDGLKDRFDASSNASLVEKNTAQQKQIDDEVGLRRRALGDFIKTAILVIGAVVAGHLGGRWL